MNDDPENKARRVLYDKPNGLCSHCGARLNEHLMGGYVLNNDVNKILDERKKTHGDFTEQANITHAIKNPMHSAPNYKNLSFVQRECLDMIAHKIGRILAGDPNVKDHWTDISGYSTLVANRCPEPTEGPKHA